jgi:mRNA interferase MazF
VTPLPYFPDAGDLIWTDFDPRVGREQSGRRPALVLSPSAFARFTGLAVVCPITSTIRNYATSVILPAGLAIAGEILVSHVRSIDIQARPIRFSGIAVPETVLMEARDRLASITGLT